MISIYICPYHSNMNDKERITRRVPRNLMSCSKGPCNCRTNMTQAPVTKTKSVVTFLCIFDGLRKPSIRRLIRKPRTICNKPLLTFDPSFYAPSSTKALSDLYKHSINCPCEIAVDPSVQTVVDMLRKESNKMPLHRVLIHYFGQGCYYPSDSNIFFFNDDRSRYKSMKFSTLLNSCPFPLCIVLDCPKASSLAKIISSKRDSFAFFACGANEKLPLSPSLPLDLFSSCLFQPFTIAIWCQNLNHCNIFDTYKLNIDSVINNGNDNDNSDSESDSENESSLYEISNSYLSSSSNFNFFASDNKFNNNNNNNSYSNNNNSYNNANSNQNNEFTEVCQTQFKVKNVKFLKKMLDAILESICFDTQDPATFDLFSRDPAIRVLFKGFALAQRVMLSYNLHPSTYPELKPMMGHVLWSFWDIVIDTYMTLPSVTAKKSIFNLFIKTFEMYPQTGSGYFPLFAFFISLPEVHEETALKLFAYLDESPPEISERASRTELPKSIINFENPSAVSLTLLAKLIAASSNSFIEDSTQIYFSFNDDVNTLLAGMIFLTVALHLNWYQSYKKFANLCYEHPVDCAPFSLLLYGVIMEKSNGVPHFEVTSKSNIDKEKDFIEKAIFLLEDHRDDIRAASLFALGFSSHRNNKNKNDVQVEEKKNNSELIAKFLEDRSPVVRIQALFALILTCVKSGDYSKYSAQIDKLARDSSVDVKSSYNLVRPYITWLKSKQTPSNTNNSASSNNNDDSKRKMSSSPSGDNIKESDDSGFSHQSRARTSSLSSLRSSKISSYASGSGLDIGIGGFGIGFGMCGHAKNKGNSIESEIASVNPIIPHLIISLKEANFEQRFDTNVFNINFPPISRNQRSATETGSSGFQMPRSSGFLSLSKQHT